MTAQFSGVTDTSRNELEMIGKGRCPAIFAAAASGDFTTLYEVATALAEFKIWTDYEENTGPDVEVMYDYDVDYAGPPLPFRAVDTAEGLQEALQDGTNHILIVAHLDATELTLDLPRSGEASTSNGAIAEVQATTLSIAVRYQYHEHVASRLFLSPVYRVFKLDHVMQMAIKRLVT